LAATFAAIKAEIPDSRLTVLGKHSGLTGRFLRDTVSFGLEESVSTIGFVDDVELMRLYQSATALLHPSLYEGCPMSVLEAMSQGCPVLGFRIPSLVYLAGDKMRKLLAPPGDLKSLASAAILLGTDHALRAAVSREARDRVRSCFSSLQCIEAYERLFLAVDSAPRSGQLTSSNLTK